MIGCGRCAPQMVDQDSALLQVERSHSRLVAAVVVDRRRLTSGSGDHVKLHFGMDDAAVARRHVAPALAAIAIHFHGMEETRVRRETLWDHGSDVLTERMQSWADPRRRGYVAQPPEFCSPGGRRTSVLSEHHHARSALATEHRQPQLHSYRSALRADIRMARRAGRKPASRATPRASASAPSARSGPTTKIAAGFVRGFSCRMMRSMS